MPNILKEAGAADPALRLAVGALTAPELGGGDHSASGELPYGRSCVRPVGYGGQ